MRVTPNGVGTLARWRRIRRPALSAPTFFSGGEAVIDKKPCAWKLASDSAWARPWRNRPGPRDRRRIAGSPDRRTAGAPDRWILQMRRRHLMRVGLQRRNQRVQR